MGNKISLTVDKLVDSFLVYLIDDGIASNSLKHYKSDLSHFSGWMFFKTQSWGVLTEGFSELLPFLNKSIAEEYKSFMLINNSAAKTINRRLSTLRRLSRFLLKANLISTDFMEGVVNVSLTGSRPNTLAPLVVEFKKKLEAERVSPNTIKNYLSDINHFINWFESH